MTSRPSTATDDGDESSLELDACAANSTTATHPNRGDAGNSKTCAAVLKSRPSLGRNGRQSSFDWRRSNGHNDHASSRAVTPTTLSQPPLAAPPATFALGKMAPPFALVKLGRSPWSMTLLVFVTASLGVVVLFSILRSLVSHQVEPKGCRMSYMRPSYLHFPDFDTEHTLRHQILALPLPRARYRRRKQGSYKQVRPIAAESANYFHYALQHDGVSEESGVRNLDFFTVDFNEDITAFHGQTLLDQAEYLNEAIRYILSLYSDPQRVDRDSQLPDPTSVILLGHSMGGIVARAMLVQSNYQPNSINTIVTMSAPHARPPVTFDGQIVQIYDEINDYWRKAYAQKWANDNPLWHVTLVSIAGGSLDNVVPSDYAGLESLVPETHGFTVFTTGIPTVWTSMDHQAILWCDQFRKVVARALYDIVDVHRASQTKPRADRMRLLKGRFLPGIEAATEKTLLLREATTLLTLGENSSRIVPAGVRLDLPSLGAHSRPTAHLLPIPPQGSPGLKRFTLITDAGLDEAGVNGYLEVLVCSVFPFQPDSAGSQFSTHIDMSGGTSAQTRLACKNAASDAIFLPASTASTRSPFYLDGEQEIQPFTYLQYGSEHLAEHQFIAVVDKGASPPRGFVMAEFGDQDDFQKEYDMGLAELLTLGLSFSLPADRPMVIDVGIPAVTSALLAYDLQVGQSPCPGRQALFAPLVRQYLNKPYESKYFVNARRASVSFHGIAPYVPPPLESREQAGLAFQFWSDPACDAPLEITLKVDVWGSMGKLYMRYRTALAAFPLLVVTLVLRKQFSVYDKTGIFISFSESLDLSLRRSVPLLLLSLTLLSTSLRGSLDFGHWLAWSGRSTSRSAVGGFHRNELLIGTDDPVFCWLVPLIGVASIGACTGLHYLMLGLTRALGLLYVLVSGEPVAGAGSDQEHPAASPALVPSTPRRRMISTAVLLFLVLTFIPYQFAFLVACLVQLFTAARAFRACSIAASTFGFNYYHYAHSILLLMVWVLPVNLPILAVWVRNLAVHWLTPFSSHHNVLSIMPFILLVENLTTGRMVPQIASWPRHITSILLFGTALCAAVYGVSHAYILHYLVNVVAAWLVVLHSTSDSWTLSSLGAIFEGDAGEALKSGKSP